jgi:hypothetical protein
LFLYLEELLGKLHMQPLLIGFQWMRNIAKIELFHLQIIVPRK